ncbi:hypothetical protein AEQU2_02332 [Aequorivita lipolytica]|nr:hypothetical protein AEQU2_02332 [Aequorivita lipolytica]
MFWIYLLNEDFSNKLIQFLLKKLNIASLKLITNLFTYEKNSLPSSFIRFNCRIFPK